MSLVLEQQQEVTLRDKLHLMAETLRNPGEIEQCYLSLVYELNPNKMCVFGLLGFRAGIPREDINWDKNHEIYIDILKKYGINEKEATKTLIKFNVNAKTLTTSLRGMYKINDEGYTFDEIADVLDQTADKL